MTSKKQRGKNEHVGTVIDPEQVEGTADDIIGVNPYGPDVQDLWEVYQLHKHCFNNVDHVDTGLELRTPKETLEKGGDCEDQSVLLSSLLLSRGFPARIISAHGHCVPEVFLPRGLNEETNEQIAKIYGEENSSSFFACGDLDRGEGLDGHWFAVDTGRSYYIGDLDVLFDDEIVVEKEGLWTWNNFKASFSKMPEDYGFENRFNN